MFFLSQLINDIWYFVSLPLLMIHSDWTHSKVSFTEQKVDYNIIYHKQNEPLKRSLNFFLWKRVLQTRYRR